MTPRPTGRAGRCAESGSRAASCGGVRRKLVNPAGPLRCHGLRLLRAAPGSGVEAVSTLKDRGTRSAGHRRGEPEQRLAASAAPWHIHWHDPVGLQSGNCLPFPAPTSHASSDPPLRSFFSTPHAVFPKIVELHAMISRLMGEAGRLRAHVDTGHGFVIDCRRVR